MSVTVMSDPDDAPEDKGVSYWVTKELLDVIGQRPSWRAAAEFLLARWEYGFSNGRLRKSGHHWIVEFRFPPLRSEMGVACGSRIPGFDYPLDSGLPSFIFSAHPDTFVKDVETATADGFRRLNRNELDHAIDIGLKLDIMPLRLKRREAFMVEFEDGTVKDVDALHVWGLYARVVKE